jgi:hypothetical protein
LRVWLVNVQSSGQFLSLTEISRLDRPTARG